MNKTIKNCVKQFKGMTRKSKGGNMTRSIGAGMALFGMYGWKTYLFAGSGFAWPITLTLVIGGTIVSSLGGKK